MIHMKVFDREFHVNFISFDKIESTSHKETRVVFSVENRGYIYSYIATPGQALAYVHSDGNEIYSPFQHLEGGSYFVEIGRRLSQMHIKELTK